MGHSTSIDGLCFASRIEGHAGPAAFQSRLVDGLRQRGLVVSYLPDCRPGRPLLIVGGTRRIAQVWSAKRAGSLVVQRLNGMNWIHRRRRTGLRHYLKAEWSNWLLRFTRRRLADAVVYQSLFVRDWWEREAGGVEAESAVIYNGVPLEKFKPGGLSLPEDRIRILLVEGNLGGGYEIGLRWAMELAALLRQQTGTRVEVAVAGAPSSKIQMAGHAADSSWLGVLTPAEVAQEHQRSHLLFASDLHPACPNSVLEALASGLPVLAFDTGALSEILDEQSGVLVDYGSNPWNVDPPDIAGLAAGAREILDNRPSLSEGARRRAEKFFGQQAMVENYIQAIEGWRV